MQFLILYAVGCHVYDREAGVVRLEEKFSKM